MRSHRFRRFWLGLPIWSVLALLAVFALLACAATPPSSNGAGPIDATQASAASVAAPGPTRATSRPEHERAKVPVSDADPQWGGVDAPVTIVVFSDFQCPFCSRVVPTLAGLEAKYGPEQLRVVFKHNPLPFHQSARPAAEAATAVFMLAGSRAFFDFHDKLFAHQNELSTENYETWASEVGVRAEALRAFLAAGKATAKVEADMALARAVGANGTPGFRINGVTLSGAQPISAFIEVVDAQLDAARALTKSGTPPRLVYSTLTDKNVELAPTPKPDPEEDDTTVWKVPVLPDDPQRGPPDALVTIVELADFECPFCGRVEVTLAKLREKYGADLRVVWKDNPLPFHAHALPAAKLGRAIYQVHGNDAFWKLHDALLAQQDALSDNDLEGLAVKQGLSWKQLQAPMASPKLAARLDDSAILADDFAARGTPSFFINGRRLRGAQPLEAFQRLIDAELVKARALVEAGTARAKVYDSLLRDGLAPPDPETKHIAIPSGAPSKGNAKAPVVIQEFSDFQCPFCKRVQPTLAQLEQDFGNQVRFVWRHLPLPFHDRAQIAAEAAEEAYAQKGDVGFWKFHDRLFEVQGDPAAFERANLERIASELQLDLPKFRLALDSHKHAAKVAADAAAAAAAGLNGTPAFLINDYYLSGAQPVASFAKLIRLAKKTPAKR